MPTGGFTVLADNIATVFEKDLNPDPGEVCSCRERLAKSSAPGLRSGCPEAPVEDGRDAARLQPAAGQGSLRRGKSLSWVRSDQPSSRAHWSTSQKVTTSRPSQILGVLTPIEQVRQAAEPFVRRGGIYEETRLQTWTPV